MDIGRVEIESWHFARGFHSIGYHFVIRRNGTIEIGRKADAIGAHCIGHNDDSVGICLVGGLDEHGKPDNNFNPAQMVSLRVLCKGLGVEYPGAEVIGHRDVPGVAKDCPCFDVRKWYAGCK